MSIGNLIFVNTPPQRTWLLVQMQFRVSPLGSDRGGAVGRLRIRLLVVTLYLEVVQQDVAHAPAGCHALFRVSA